MKYTEHVECKEEMRNSNKILVRKPEGQDCARLMHRWEYNIKMDLKKREFTDVNWIPLVSDKLCEHSDEHYVLQKVRI
jgi:hypothetical protein